MLQPARRYTKDEILGIKLLIILAIALIAFTITVKIAENSQDKIEAPRHHAEY